MNHPDVSDNSYAIIVTPTLTPAGTWTGEVSVSISLSQDNTLSEPDRIELEMLCEYMTSVLPAIEDDEKVRDLLGTYVGESIRRTDDSSLVDFQEVFNFQTPTKGSA